MKPTAGRCGHRCTRSSLARRISRLCTMHPVQAGVHCTRSSYAHAEPCGKFRISDQSHKRVQQSGSCWLAKTMRYPVVPEWRALVCAPPCHAGTGRACCRAVCHCTACLERLRLGDDEPGRGHAMPCKPAQARSSQGDQRALAGQHRLVARRAALPDHKPRAQEPKATRAGCAPNKPDGVQDCATGCKALFADTALLTPWQGIPIAARVPILLSAHLCETTRMETYCMRESYTAIHITRACCNNWVRSLDRILSKIPVHAIPRTDPCTCATLGSEGPGQKKYLAFRLCSCMWVFAYHRNASALASAGPYMDGLPRSSTRSSAHSLRPAVQPVGARRR